MASGGNNPGWIGSDEDFDVVFPSNVQLPFQVLQLLGKGYFGIVHKILAGNRVLARKATKNITHVDIAKIAEVQNQINVMRRLGFHRHIVQIVGSYTQAMQYGIILSPVADCNLEQYLANSTGPGLDAVQRRTSILPNIPGCLASGLSWAHGHNVRHKDLKPNNVLILDNKVLISDFGLAKVFERAPSEAEFEATLRKMFSEQKDNRPSAIEVWQSALASRTGDGVCFCGECCMDIKHV